MKTKYLQCDKCEEGITPDSFEEAVMFGDRCKWCDLYLCGRCFIRHEAEEHSEMVA